MPSLITLGSMSALGFGGMQQNNCSVVASIVTASSGYVSGACGGGFFWASTLQDISESNMTVNYPTNYSEAPVAFLTSVFAPEAVTVGMSTYYNQISEVYKDYMILNGNSEYGTMPPSNSTAWVFGIFDSAATLGSYGSSTRTGLSFPGANTVKLAGKKMYYQTTTNVPYDTNVIFDIPNLNNPSFGASYWNDSDVPDLYPTIISQNNSQVTGALINDGTAGPGPGFQLLAIESGYYGPVLVQAFLISDLNYIHNETGYFSFPIEFPNACFMVFPTPQCNSATHGSPGPVVVNITKSGCSLYFTSSQYRNEQTVTGIYFIVIGN